MSPYKVISEQEDEYPNSLRRVLGGRPFYSVGNVDLLDRPAIGICGSRNATEGGLGRALDFGREAAEKGMVVVSGYAKGVDRQAHRGALEAGGATVAVLPQGIRFFRLVKALASLVDSETNFLAISGFDPDAPWKPWRAMERNKIIVALSRGLFVIEARETGGTIDAANESKRQLKPVYIVDFGTGTPERQGNRNLLADSIGRPVRTLRDLRVALDELISNQSGINGQLALISDDHASYSPGNRE